MRPAPLPIPGLVLGAYPEREDDRSPPPIGEGLGSLLPGSARRRLGVLKAAAARVQAHFDGFRILSPEQLFAELPRGRAELARDGLRSAAAERLMAMVMVAIWHSHGRRLRDNQIMAALTVLQGALAEVQTGEGKTLATATAACVAALAGIPVHVVTSNDYLAARDAEHLLPIARRLELSVAAVAGGLGTQGRHQAYAASICFCAARELVFDYLRDSLQPAAPSATAAGRVLRGLCMAIVDEADSVLIDEAATPFILSESYREPEQHAACTQALRLARGLRAGFDFRVDARDGRISLADSACAAIAARDEAEEGGPLWTIPRYRQEMVELAIRALHVLKRDEHYLVRDGKVEIIDSTSGRIASGRAWSRGLHQMVEMKERCEPTPATRVLAQISFQRFFTRYLHLGGMSGTLVEAQDELRRCYGLRVQPIPSSQPSRLAIAPPRVFARAAQRWPAVIAEIRRLHAEGLPVLVGTDSVRESERLARLLEQAGLPHRVLNARQDRAEAELIAAAGQPGAITVTTNMAGRGTDILIDEAVARAGGLQVVSCQHNSARRIDRQLFGRAGRLGQPGSAVAILSLEEGLLGRSLLPISRRLLGLASRADGTLPIFLGKALVRLTQSKEERRAARARRLLRERDAQQGRRQSFGLASE